MINPAALIITALALVISVALIIVFMLRIALRARQAKRTVCETGILGLSGRAVTPVSPEGTVFVRNELWRARASRYIAEGESVRVTGLDGLTLKVDTLKVDTLEDDR